MIQGRCENCKFWDQRNGSIDGTCEAIEMDEKPRLKTDGSAIILYRADDDQGLDMNLFTGPEFGCVLHKTKESDGTTE